MDNNLVFSLLACYKFSLIKFKFKKKSVTEFERQSPKGDSRHQSDEKLP